MKAVFRGSLRLLSLIPVNWTIEAIFGIWGIYVFLFSAFGSSFAVIWTIHWNVYRFILWAQCICSSLIRPRSATSVDTAPEHCNISFVYEPLNESKRQVRFIRVCDIMDDPIRCELCIFSLYDVPRFSALSYRWTDEKSMCPITLSAQRFVVKPHVHSYLQQLRQERNFDWIFIDAICVAQHDPAERSSQVRLMSDIFGDAEEVVAWIRPRHDSVMVTDQIFDKVQSMLHEPKNTISEQCALTQKVLTATDKETTPSFMMNWFTFLFSCDDYWTRL